MQYNLLGNSTLNVSQICLGSMTWGEQNTQRDASEQMALALEHGINFFDVAEMYPVPPKPETYGQSELIMGEWIKQNNQRKNIILATKVAGASSRNRGVNHIRGGANLGRDHIFSACENSLKRLQTDYIDLYQIHWPERATNFFGKLEYQHQPEEDGIAIHESLSAVSELVKQGKVRYIGISNETPWGIHEYLRLASHYNLENIISVQNPYNLLNRTWDIGGSEMCLRENIGVLAYSPLAFGKLSGKYLNNQMPEGSRIALYDRFSRYDKTNCDEAIAAYASVAHDHNLTPSQLALAFVNQRPYVTSNIIGATTLEQLRENISSHAITLTRELLDDINAIHTQYPNPAP